MSVGDLVKFKANDILGLIVSIRSDMFRVQWADGVYSNRFENELEVISESR